MDEVPITPLGYWICTKPLKFSYKAFCWQIVVSVNGKQVYRCVACIQPNSRTAERLCLISRVGRGLFGQIPDFLGKRWESGTLGGHGFCGHFETLHLFFFRVELVVIRLERQRDDSLEEVKTARCYLLAF